ncbi:hypothetical protein [Dyadobacter sp. OTU695]|uniref:hypothetical protein n=1 Tax=Dyadobacter sp. OTU695 TaxID=3043860 RepID=UPI00313E9863
MKAIRHQSASKPKKAMHSNGELEQSQKRPGITDEPGRRKLGLYDGMPGYFMSDDFCITTKEEFDI